MAGNSNGLPSAYYVRQASLTDQSLIQLANEQAAEITTLRASNQMLHQQVNHLTQMRNDPQVITRNIVAATCASLQPLLRD